MKKWLILLLGVTLLGGGIAALWPGPRPAPSSEPAASHESLSAFEPVEVLSQDGEGLTLTGRVLDNRGIPVAGAEVFLASSAQSHLHTLRCGHCEERLLVCRARESALSVHELLQRELGALRPAATTRTDGQGAFRFEHLAGVSFTVWARASGWGEASRERAAPGESVELFLPPLRSIAGQLVDSQGQPIRGGTVHAVSHRLSAPRRVHTDERGIFELRELGEGPFYVLAEADGFQPSALPSVEAGPRMVRIALIPSRVLQVSVVSGGVPAEAMVVLSGDHLKRQAVAKNGTATFDRLYPDKVVVSASMGSLSSAPQPLSLDSLVTRITLQLEPGAWLRVSVVDDSGQPVVSPSLRLLRPDGEVIAEQRAGTGELVSFGPIGVGEYHLQATAAGYAQQELPVSLSPGEASLEVVMAKGTVISGRVLDEYGRPAPGVSILVSPIGDSALADSNGAFSIQVPSPGLYQLHAHHSVWGGGQVKVTAPVAGVELGLEPRAAAEITVLAEGRRIEGAHAVLYVEKEGSFRSDSPSASDGRVLMRGMPAGTYWMVATHSEYLPSDKQRVTLVDGELLKLTAELKLGAKLGGEVVDTQGAPVSGVVVAIVPRGAEPAISNGVGRFELGPVRPGATYRLEARHPAFEQLERVVAKAGDASARVVLRRKAVFTGRVRAEDGAPIKRFRIDDHQIDSVDGRFEVALSSVEDRVIFAAEAPGFEPLMVDHPATPDLGDLVLRRAPAFNGVVRDASGAPASEVVVTCDVCSASVMSAADGSFHLTSPPFVAQFTVTARKGMLSSHKQVTAGANQPVELVLQPATRVFGVAYLPDGRPAAGAELEGVSVERSEPVSIVTGPDGRYSTDLPPGFYRFNHSPLLDVGRALNPIALTLEVSGPELQLDFGPGPASTSLTVRVQPQRGYALWLVRGSLPVVSNPPMELIRSTYALMMFQPSQEEVTFTGLAPGRYTVVWGSFHAATDGGPLLVPVSVPSSGPLVLTKEGRLVAP